MAASSCTSVRVNISDNTGFDSDLDSPTEESELEKDKRTVVSLMDRLKSPMSANIARPTKTNDPLRGRLRPCRGALSSDPKGVGVCIS